ncbi:uncharacterized protein LOC125004645 [Mugil cephalus]|uniref:uncharacterized protein LOC125004645 n=1 Tax=Mugil cephalus TaxID=48193 RepID=UPI001FB80923|nr:uncharacterized protein LOC125004645 [Mugil cephalus]
MNFANLFTRLPAVNEDTKNPGQPNWTHRNGNGSRGRGRKRKTDGEQTGSHHKKHCYPSQGNTPYDTFKGDAANTIPHHVQSTEGEHAPVGYTNTAINNHSNKPDHKSKCFKGQKSKTKKNFNVNNQQRQQQKKMEGQNNQREGNDRGRRLRGPMSGKGGRGAKNENAKRSFQGKSKRFMTEEFKEQNALLVDGRLLCRHFLWGRCIKEDDCQLEHIQSYNNLIKEICKFYVQGFCSKGETCPYMHKSFPCKFFHRRGNCSQGEDCKFSHEPLDDVTKRLLDEALKRESDLIEMAKKAERESSGQPENTDQSEAVEADSLPDILVQPLRTNFYNSTETKEEKETLSLQTEEPSDITDEAARPDASDAARPHSPTSTDCHHKEPVCYSVEAVLGPQLFRPFPSLFTPPGSQESASHSVPQTVSEDAVGSANQTEAPYSVDAVLRSFKSVESFTFGDRTTSPTVKHISYSPSTHPDPGRRSDHQNETFLSNTNDDADKSQEKKLRSTSFLPQRKRGRDMTVPLKVAQRPSHALLYSADAGKSASSKDTEDTKQSMHLPTDLTRSVNYGNQTRAPKQLNSCFPSQTFESQSSIKPFSAPLGPAKSKYGPVIPVEPVPTSIKTSVCASSEAKELAALSKNTQSGLKVGTPQQHSAKITQDSSSKTANLSELSAACKNIPNRPFYSLFANPINDSLTPKTESVTVPACPQGFVREDTPVKSAAEPDKTSSSSFLGLFATPPIASLSRLRSQPDYSRTPQSGQRSTNKAFHSSDSKQRASNTGSPLPGRTRTDVAQKSPEFSSGPESKTVNQPTEQLVEPVGAPVSDFTGPDSRCPTSSPAQATPQRPDASSLSGSAAHSVLKTLFLCLSPYQEDGERSQISVPSESEKKAECRMWCVFGEKGKSKKKNRRKRKNKIEGSHRESTERASAQSS